MACPSAWNGPYSLHICYNNVANEDEGWIIVNVHTNVWKINQMDSEWQKELAVPAAKLANGEQIAFPTETVYGLGANACDDEAVKGIFAAKGRPSDNPLIVHIYDKRQVYELVSHVGRMAERLMETFWPGPLTIILPVKQGILSALVTAGLDTVGIRMPDHAVALELMRQAAVPVAAPSANTSGRPSPTVAAHVYTDLSGKIAGIVDGGPTGVGLESTVVELVDETHIQVLRPGGVTLEQLQICCPEAQITMDIELLSQEAPRSPGMKYTHYAPQGQLTVVQGEPEAVSAYIQKQLVLYGNAHRCGVLFFDEHEHYESRASLALSLGSMHELEQAAARLYDALRQFDEQRIEYIWSEASTTAGIGAAFMNRLLKASGHQVIKV